MTIGIIAAMQMELDGLKTVMADAVTETVSGMEFVRGRIAGKNVVAVVCGIGKVFAAMCAQTLILKYAPDAVLNIGVAGAVGPGLRVLDLVVADRVCQHDLDTSPLGDPVGMVSGVNLVYFPADPGLSGALLRAAAGCGYSAVAGTVASGDQFVADPARKEQIHTLFGAAAVEMEGGSVAQVCAVNAVPFAVLRCISDGDGGGMDYETFAPRAARQSIDVVLRFLEHEVMV